MNLFSSTLFFTKYYTFERNSSKMQKLFVFIFCFLPWLVMGQGLRINVQLDQAQGKKVFLAHYYIDKIYSDDSIQLDASGKGIFQRDTLLPQGLYKIFMDDKNNFDFLLGADQQFSLHNSSFSSESEKVTGAVETEEFVNYMHFLGGLRKESTELKTKMSRATTLNERQELQRQLSQLTPKLQQYWFRIKEKYPDTFLSKFLLANYIPEIDISKLPAEIQSNDSLLLLTRFYYQQKHFWDYFDYTDERFLYTPLFHSKMETWFTKALFQDYDSVRTPVLEMIEKVRPHPRIFQFMVSWFLNTTANSNVIGMDALFVELAQKYYLSGEAFWASEETIKNIRENVIFLQNNLLGMKAPDLTLETVDGDFVDLHKIEAKITIVLIFEPNCSHCQEFVPKFHDEIYEKFKNQGLAVYAIYSMDNKEEWTEFLTKHQLYDWINVWDPTNLTDFKILYDARKTPGVYVLDENKTIIAKKLSVEQLDVLLNEKL